jgi:signal transduction histidine kinase
MKEPILLVDDESGIRKVLGIALEDSGYAVYPAATGQEALDIFREIKPQIVITDIKMPGMDGLDLLKTIKQEAPETEVIMVTGHGDMELAIKSLKHDATDFITKPINDEVLEFALKRAHERIALRRQIREYTHDLEALVARKTRELIDAERLAAIGQTIAGLSHAIKNIASGLEAGTFVLEKGLELDQKEYRQQGWSMVRDNVAKIKRLSLDLLGYAKPASLNRKPTDPNQPARDVLDLMASKARELGVELVADLAQNPPDVNLDAEAIHRCLLNLITNALEACSDENRPVPVRTVSLSSRTAPDWGIVYQVNDSGPGLDQSVKEKLFSAFFSTKGSQGTGIGLMLTKKIVEEHGGRISAESTPGLGAVFTISLP